MALSQPAIRMLLEIKKIRIQFQGNLDAKLITFRDITSIIEEEKARNEKASLEMLTATVGHEMLTPLNSVINMSDMLMQALNQQAQASPSSGPSLQDLENRQLVEMIHSSGNFLLYLVNDLTDLMKI